jgi:hypothetical protein
MDSSTTRWSAAFLVAGYVASILGALSSTLYLVTLSAVAVVAVMVTAEWALERRRARARAQLRRPRLAEWRPTYFGCF